MTNYITFTINEEVLNFLSWFFLGIMIFIIIFEFIKLIIDIFEQNKREAFRNKCDFYVREYQKLLRIGTDEEIKAFSKKYDKYLSGGLYYW